jgi:hypothetical protein
MAAECVASLSVMLAKIAGRQSVALAAYTSCASCSSSRM